MLIDYPECTEPQSRWWARRGRFAFLSLVCLLATQIGALCPGPAIAAPPAKMRFIGSPGGRLLSNAWFIFGEGEITEGTAASLKNFVRKYNVPSGGSTLFLDSPGGSVFGGMQLGRAIRSLGLETEVGKLVGGNPIGPDLVAPLSVKLGPGGCYSACTLAFIGGVWRFGDEKSDFGVHRFYSSALLPGAESSAVAQVASGLIVNYIREMGVSSEMFTLMTKAPAAGIYLIPLQEQKVLRIINNGEGPTTWKIVTRLVNKGWLYLRGSRDSQYGINKFMILCAHGSGARFTGIFSAPHRGKEISTKLREHFLWINNNKVPLPGNRTSIKNDGEFVFIDALLSPRTLATIEQAKTVGIGVDAGKHAPVFLGFDGMPFGAEAKRDLQAVLRMCR